MSGHDRTFSEDIYGPNFGNALPSAAVDLEEDAPSSKPVLKQHNADDIAQSQHSKPDAEQEDDFFDRYPGATPKKRNALDTLIAQAQQGDDQEDSKGTSDMVDTLAQPRTESASSEVRDREEPVENAVTTNAQSKVAPGTDGEQAISGSTESTEEQEQHLEALAIDSQDPEQEMNGLVAEQDLPARPAQHDALVSSPDVNQVAQDDLKRPEAHYEHQGEVTEMEAAVDESADAPLMEDEEVLPTAVTVRDGQSVELDEQSAGTASILRLSSAAETAPPPINRSFTTNFVASSDVTSHAGNSLEQVSAQQIDTIDGQWPAIGDDKTFGELLEGNDALASHEPSRSRPDGGEDALAQLDGDNFEALVGMTESASVMEATDSSFGDETELLAKPTSKEDLAAAWGAALDDDDFLEESSELDPSTLFGDDDDDFLADDEPDAAYAPSQTGRLPEASSQTLGRSSVSYMPSSALPQNPYSVPGGQPFSQHGRTSGTPDTGLVGLYSQAPKSQTQQQTRPTLNAAQSFADKSKGGYQSPYDLPMDVTKPRRRPQQQPVVTPSTAHVPPPRTTSQSSNIIADQVASYQGPPQQPRIPSIQTPPSSSHGGLPKPASNASSSVRSTPKGDNSFFEDLPIAPKLRARPSSAYTPQAVQTVRTESPASTQNSAPPMYPSRPAGPPQQYSASMGIGQGFRQPERLPLLPEQSATPPVSALGAPPVLTARYSPSSQPGSVTMQSRYSPAPSASTSTSSRYSPAPAQSGQAKTRYGPSPSRNPSAGSHYFAPRTSSPLTSQLDKPHPPLPPGVTSPMSPPFANGTPETHAASTPPSAQKPMLQRSQTQSPSATMKNPRMIAQGLERPTSAADVSSGRPYVPSLQPSLIRNQTDVRNVSQQRSGPALPHRRQFSSELSFAVPQDEQSQDPLNRWQGHPIFSWTASGAILSSLPQQTPFYAAGHAIPAIRCTPGSISLQDASTFLAMDVRNAAFPGPLAARSKGRKKEVLTWLASKVEDLERSYEASRLDFNMESSSRKRFEEKVILWKIVKLLVEHDGALEGKPELSAAVRKVLLPNPTGMASIADVQTPLSATVQTEPVDKHIIFQLRAALLEGDRDRAVWLAEEKKLWGHAMLIASTLGPEVWKQVIQSFVRSQVQSAGSDARSMAALYQIFAGNSEECVDELVPPSARAGFQMISKTDGSVYGNPLEGLDQWRETLGLVVGNRTGNDAQSLISLGKLLASYGRVEAAHTCYLFARLSVKHSGADDPDTHFALLGASHQALDEPFGGDLDSILLTEIYEWSSSLSLPSTSVAYVPHLQSFKLVHAQQLAAHGFKTKAQQYCSHITSAYTSTTRPSQYYHPVFTQAVSDLSAFLAQSPHDGKGSSSIFRKEVMNKASSGAASWFTKFVSGDDDAQTSGSGAGNDQIGTPFGGVNSDTPPISRTTSNAELYNPMAASMAPQGVISSTAFAQPSNPYAPTAATSRYAPYGTQPQLPESRPLPSRSTSKYAPHDSPGAASYNSQSMISPVRANSHTGLPPIEGQQAAPVHTHATPSYGSTYSNYSRRGSAQDSDAQDSYEPKSAPADANPYGYTPPMPQPDHSSDMSNENGLSEGVVNECGPSANDSYEPPTSGYGYEPPTTSYQPYEPEPESPEDAPKSKKKGIMNLDDDDDDHLIKQAAALKKAQADREADEAFRKAAEADASRQSGGPDNKGGWFGGWFKKDAAAGPGPIRAKLGDQSSFVYDETLKKWVNKKGGAETATATSATPPPPRAGPPSRVTSGNMGPPSSGVPSRVASSSGMPPPMGIRPSTSGSGPNYPGSGPPSRAGTPASFDPSGMPANGDVLPHLPSLAPPSRPGTGMSNASSLDDLLGAPGGGRKAGGTIKGKKKGGRYVDVMAGK